MHLTQQRVPRYGTRLKESLAELDKLEIAIAHAEERGRSALKLERQRDALMVRISRIEEMITQLQDALG